MLWSAFNNVRSLANSQLLMTCKLRVFLDQRKSTFLDLLDSGSQRDLSLYIKGHEFPAIACTSTPFHLKKGLGDRRIDVLITSARVTSELVPYVNSWTLMA